MVNYPKETNTKENKAKDTGQQGPIRHHDYTKKFSPFRNPDLSVRAPPINSYYKAPSVRASGTPP